MHRRWLVSRTNPPFVKYLSSAASISPVLAQILINRGIKTAAEIRSFLSPGLSQLMDPFEMEGIQSAVDRISRAVRRGEKVLVCGDYDVDGVAATAILMRALRAIGADCDYFIPNRMIQGYGFKPSSVTQAKRSGASLIITVDCGITSFEAAALCRKDGIDLIVTDHHEPFMGKAAPLSAPPGREGWAGEEVAGDHFLLPEAAAVVNPRLSCLQTSAANLSGAGVALKLAQALSLSFRGNSAVEEFLDLAALGTVADVVPLTGENRAIVAEGLKLINAGIFPGLKALKEAAGFGGKELKTGQLVFTLVPRINAAGRIDDANTVVRLLLTDSPDEAVDISLMLERQNAERQRIEKTVYQEAIHMLNEKDISPVIVLAAEGWHPGVIGIVAARIAEDFCLPVVLLSIEGDLARGSARSIPAFDINTAFSSCRDLLKAFGGHKQAAGLELEVRNIPQFEKRMHIIAREMLTDEDFVPSLEIDAEVEFSDITFNLTREIELLEPFGRGNPEPLLGSKELEMISPRIVKENHLKMRLRQKNQSIEAIGFAMASLYERLSSESTVDAVFTPSLNEWEDSRYLQLHLKALRPSK